MRPVVEFSDLIRPMKADAFFSDYYGVKSCLGQGDAELYQSFLSWDDVSAFLEMTSVWTDETLKVVLDEETMTPEAYCHSVTGRDGVRVMQPVPAKINEWMAKGASVVLNSVEHLHPGLRSIAEAISFATNTLVNANIYCSFAGHKAFRSHFDTTDVFVFQVDGKKKWRVYEGRFNEPYPDEGFFFPSFDDAYHKRAKGKVAHSPTLEPGHFLYLPKGVYHDALAMDGPSLHVTFATTEARGVDFLKTIFNSLSEVPAFRAALPDFDQADVHSAHIRNLAGQLHEILMQPDIAEQMRDDQKKRAFAPVSRFDIPTETGAEIYRVRHIESALSLGSDGYVLKVEGQLMQVSGDAAKAIEWVRGRSAFVVQEFSDAAPDMDDALRNDLLGALCDIGLTEKLAR